MMRVGRPLRAILGGFLLTFPFTSMAGVAHAETNAMVADAPTINAVQQVIRTSNSLESQAVALRDPSQLATTATSDYYQWLSQVIRQNLDAGLIDIHLDHVRWGAVSINGTTAQVSDREKWTMTYSDGTTVGQIGSWVYSLVFDNGSWKIQSATSLPVE